MGNLLTENLYTVVAREGEEHVVLTLCGEDHPLFKAHFPGNPILPGFMQLDILTEVLGKTITAISSAKFMNVIRPGMTIVYAVSAAKKGVRVVVKDETGTVLSDFKVEWI